MGLKMREEELGEERELVLDGTKLKRYARTKTWREGGRKRGKGNKVYGLMVGN